MTNSVKTFLARLFCWHLYEYTESVRFVKSTAAQGFPPPVCEIVHTYQCKKCGAWHYYSIYSDRV